MLLVEFLETFHLEPVVDIWIGIERRLHDCRLSPAGRDGVLLVAHVIVRKSGQLATLPAEMTLIPSHVQRAEEEKTIGNH